MITWLKTYRPHISVSVLVILYAVGLVGLGTSHKAWFLAATPLTLLISAGLLLLNHRDWNAAAAAGFAMCAVIGFGVEVVGVHTGLIFGAYHYGETLGTKLWDVPLVIGLNWLLLAYASASIVSRLRVPRVAQAALAASLMTGLDLLIEPVAIRLDFWQWAGGVVPLQNYLGWFCVSFVLLLAFQYLKFQKENPIAAPVLAMQFIFFGTLNFMH